VKALAKYFTKASEHGAKHSAGGQKAGSKDTKSGGVPPELTPRPKPFRIDASGSSVRILPNGNRGPQKDKLPITCNLELAYEGLDQDPFKEYDPFDFDLSDTGTHEIQSNGINITSRSGNKIEFDVLEPDFNLQVGGFDSNIRMRTRLNFKEEANGATVSAE
jgi:hypothetical protein